MQTLNLTNPASVQEIFEQVSHQIPFRVADLAALSGVVPIYPNQLAIVDNLGAHQYDATLGEWVTISETALNLQLVQLQQTLTNLTIHVNEQLLVLNEQINGVSITANQVDGLSAFVRDTALIGLDLSNAQPVVAGIALLDAIGRLQRQITDTVVALGNEIDARQVALSGKEDTGTAAAYAAAHAAATDPHPQYQADLVSGTNIKTINEQSILGAGNIEIQSGVSSVAYDNRDSLRSQSPVNGEMAVIDGLGLFVFATGSDEPDDDESCFATATGRWLLQAVHWDVVDTWQLPDDGERDAYDENEPLRFAAKILSGTATCAVTTVAATSSVAFTGTVAGAAPGARVLAQPPGALGATDAGSARLSFHAYVSATDTVTVRLTNASAAAATTNTAIQTAWPITVIKS